MPRLTLSQRRARALLYLSCCLCSLGCQPPPSSSNDLPDVDQATDTRPDIASNETRGGGDDTITETAPVCGDGVVEGDEPCDDGNGIDTDDCSNRCERVGELLCLSCTTDEACGGEDDLCVALADGAWCAVSCASTGLCPTGYVCVESEGRSGARGRQCVPTQQTCSCHDPDEDGVCWRDDNCRTIANPDQRDRDSDGQGDACDPCPEDAGDDSDLDGVCDALDACPGANDAADRDGDGVPDACDPCPDDVPPEDADDDGVCETLDLCEGDDATGDTDGDGVCDDRDVCALGDDRQDGDGDGVPDACAAEVCLDGEDNNGDEMVDCWDMQCWDRCTSSPVEAEERFQNVTTAAGVGMTHTLHERFYVTGQAWGDFDDDGWLDLYLTDHQGPNRLYRNRGDGGFEEALAGTAIALESSVSGAAVFVDYDNDGRRDIFVLNEGPNTLLRNVGGAFEDVTAAAQLGDAGRGSAAAWGDFNGDGWLDLYVTNWACDTCGPQTSLDGNLDRLYLNKGNGSFGDVSSSLGYAERTGAGFAVSFLDFDSDGDLDIYLVNDKGSQGLPQPGAMMNRNILWRNDGPGCQQWCFTEVGEALGADARVNGMGLAIGDVDGDLDLDLAFSDSIPPKLLQYEGGVFTDGSSAMGLQNHEQITWGTVLFDHDNDGDLDLYFAASAWPGRDQRNLLLDNDGAGTFTDISLGSGAEDPFNSYGVSVADYDRDGGVDLVVGDRGSGYRLYRNLEALQKNWLRVRLTGGGPINRDAVGARVHVTRSDGQELMQEVKLGSSLGSGSDLALHFGLDAHEATQVRVVWPDGTEFIPTSPAPLNGEWLISYPMTTSP